MRIGEDVLDSGAWSTASFEIKPGTFMPNLELTEKEIEALIAYLGTLKWQKLLSLINKQIYLEDLLQSMESGVG